jgi:hypothetical protein
MNDNEISTFKMYVRPVLQDYACMAWLFHSLMCHLMTSQVIRLQRVGNGRMNECGEMVEWY